MVAQDLFNLLQHDPHWLEFSEFSAETITDIEAGKIELSFMQAKSAARVLELSIEAFIKTMILKKKTANESEEDIMKMLKEELVHAIKELAYKEWKKEQERLEGE